MKKWFILFGLLLVGTLGWYGLVSSWFLTFTSDAKVISKTSPNVFLDSQELNSIVVVFQSSDNLKNHTLHSSCETSTEFLESYEDLYFFKISYLSANCESPNLTLRKWEEILVNTLFKVNFIKKADLFTFLVDYPDSHLEDVGALYKSTINANAAFRTYTGDNIGKYYTFLKGQRKLLEAEYKKELVDSILEWRKEIYLMPVPGHTITDHVGRIPNAPRPYRSAYTDGIHHGWDIFAPLWTDTVALDDGVIIRIVRGFGYEDLSTIKKTNTLSYEDQLNNLDILRWNQVWLKTRKWDVIFYSHLEDVSEDISEWDMVTKWTYFGGIGVSWVPEIGYSDYHLHFAVQKNPYDLNKIGSYTMMDYMKWDWSFKWDTASHILKHKAEVFAH